MKRIALLSGGFLMILIAGCTSRASQKEETVVYNVTSPIRLDTSLSREYVAQIQSNKNIEIRAQEKGYLQSINADEGQNVHAGQLLFTIAPNMYEADYMKAQASVREAEQEMNNSKTLSDKDIVSKSELKISEAKLDEARADLALAKVHLALTEIRAPFDGVLDRIPLKLGSLVDEGALLTTLSDNGSVYAYFNVPEEEYLAFKTKSGDAGNMQSVTLKLADGEVHKYKGSVETVEGQFDNETGNIAFRAKFPNPELLLKHGETGKVVMTVPLKNALIIPQKATYDIQDKIFVYVVDAANVVRSRPISVKYQLPDLYVVDSGLNDGDRILLEGLQSVKDDDKITASYVPPAQVISHLQLIKD